MLALCLSDQAADIHHAYGIQTGCGFVIQDDTRFNRQRPGQAHPLFHAAGKFHRIKLFRILHPHILQQAVHFLPHLLLRQPEMLPQTKRDIFTDIQEVEQRGILEHHPDMLTDLVPFLFGQVGYIPSFNQDLPACGGQQTDQHLQDGAFAGARRPDDRHGLSLFHFQVNPLQHLFLTKSKFQSLQGYHRFSHSASLIHLHTTKPSESNRI